MQFAQMANTGRNSNRCPFKPPSRANSIKIGDVVLRQGTDSAVVHVEEVLNTELR